MNYWVRSAGNGSWSECRSNARPTGTSARRLGPLNWGGMSMHSNLASEFRRLGDLLRKYDFIDLAAGIGALQLIPANADRLVRLKAAANLIASIPAEPGSPSMSLPHWRQWLNAAPLGTPPFVYEEDPFENLFTEELTYYGGSYRVFPDFCGDDAFILRHQLAAIFLNAAPFSNTEFGSAAQSLCASALLLSDTIARRCELRRGQLPLLETAEVSWFHRR